MTAPPPIALTSLVLRHGSRVAVDDLSGVFAPGSLTAILGPNGGGKTTLLRAIAGLHAVASGRIDRGDGNKTDIALLPQASALDRSFPITCADVVALGALGRVGPFRRIGGAERARVVGALDAVGLDGFEGRPIGELSAGQFQRILFARMIVQDAPVLLLDEPFAAVDAATEAALMGLIARWHAEGRTLLVVLHDHDLARERFPEALLLATAPVAWGPTASVLTVPHLHQARAA